MDKQKLKRIIVREGSVFFIALVIFIIAISEPTRNFLIYLFDSYRLTEFQIAAIRNLLRLLVFWYPIYLIIRFIIWAVRTLKEKK
jgi:hypothetical protein